MKGHVNGTQVYEVDRDSYPALAHYLGWSKTKYKKLPPTNQNSSPSPSHKPPPKVTGKSSRKISTPKKSISIDEYRTRTSLATLLKGIDFSKPLEPYTIPKKKPTTITTGNYRTEEPPQEQEKENAPLKAASAPQSMGISPVTTPVPSNPPIESPTYGAPQPEERLHDCPQFSETLDDKTYYLLKDILKRTPPSEKFQLKRDDHAKYLLSTAYRLEEEASTIIGVAGKHCPSTKEYTALREEATRLFTEADRYRAAVKFIY